MANYPTPKEEQERYEAEQQQIRRENPGVSGEIFERIILTDSIASPFSEDK